MAQTPEGLADLLIVPSYFPWDCIAVLASEFASDEQINTKAFRQQFALVIIATDELVILDGV
jgi:hypothetical protein